MDIIEVSLLDQAQILLNEYLSVEDFIQKARNFIYSELKLMKYTNITLEKERRVFNQIIDGVEDNQYREELIRVKQVFFQCIKDQMIVFQRILARHMQFVDTIQSDYPSITKSKQLKKLQKQKDSLLSYLLSSAEDDSCKSRKSNKSSSSSSLKEILQFQFQTEKRRKKISFRTLPDCDSDEEEIDTLRSNSYKKQPFAV